MREKRLIVDNRTDKPMVDVLTYVREALDKRSYMVQFVDGTVTRLFKNTKSIRVRID